VLGDPEGERSLAAAEIEHPLAIGEPGPIAVEPKHRFFGSSMVFTPAGQ
jgi:hypothetical protein